MDKHRTMFRMTRVNDATLEIEYKVQPMTAAIR